MNRPKIIINCAMSVDGKIASSIGKQVRISSEQDMKRVFKLRNKVDAILVGINTILNDDPKLTVKEKYVSSPNHPIRIVLDSQCRTPVDALVVNENADTILIKDEKIPCSKKFNDNVKIISAPKKNGVLDLEKILHHLYHKGVKTLLVEGGGTVIWHCITQGFVDDLLVFIGSIIIGGKFTPTMAMGNGFAQEHEFIQLQLLDVQQVGNGVLLHYQLQ